MGFSFDPPAIAYERAEPCTRGWNGLACCIRQGKFNGFYESSTKTAVLVDPATSDKRCRAFNEGPMFKHEACVHHGLFVKTGDPCADHHCPEFQRCAPGTV